MTGLGTTSSDAAANLEGQPQGQLPAEPLGTLDELESIEQLRRLQRVSDAALAHLTVDDLLDELLLRVREVLDADTAAILLLDAGKKELVATAAKGLEEEVERGVRIPVGKGFAGRIAAERRCVTIPRVDHTNVLNPILRERGVRSLLGAPLLAEGQVLGVLHVGTLTERAFSSGDVELLQLVADRVALALHVRLYQHERLVASALQRSVLPEALPTIPGLRISSRYVPASSIAGVGGDWYDAFLLPDRRLALAIGDVAGHGLAAASAMGKIRNAMRAIALDVQSPGEVAARVDRLVNHFDPGNMITFLYGIVDRDLGSFRFVSAGHPPPLVVGPEGATFVERADGSNPPLGVGHLRPFREQRVPLRHGSSLLLYTDGLVERKGESLNVGLDRLTGAARTWLGASRSPDPIENIIREIVPGPHPMDDIAALLVEREDPSPVLDLTVPADSRQLSVVRQATRRWLIDLSVPQTDTEDIVTACGEACTNAIEHAYGPGQGVVSVRGAFDGEKIRVVVRDSGRWRSSRSYGRGRGIMLIRGMMDRLEIDRSPSGTTMTMERAVRVAE